MEKGQDAEVQYLLMTEYGVAGKPFYSREEVKRMILELHGRHLAATFSRELEIIEMSAMKARLEEEHAKSLELLFQNEAKNVKLETLKATLEDSYLQLETVSRTDFLTGLYNRRTLIEIAEKEMKRARRTRDTMEKLVGPREEGAGREVGGNIGLFTVALADVDRFKDINDTFGHAHGDLVLKRIGEILSGPGVFRATDVSGRYGGDEFLFVFPDTRSVDAAVPVGKLLKTVEAFDFREGDVSIHVTMTAGISEILADDEKIDDVISRADAAMYDAKKRGRNRMAIFEQLDKKDGEPPGGPDGEIRKNLHFTMRPVWERIEKIGSEIGSFMSVYDGDLVYDVKMAAAELTENAVKYGSATDAREEIQIDIAIKDGCVVISVTNRVREKRHLQTAVETIRLIREAKNPKELYVSRLERLLTEEKPVSGSRLGLIRIAYIGGFGLECRESEGYLTIQATRRLQPGNGEIKGVEG